MNILNRTLLKYYASELRNLIIYIQQSMLNYPSNMDNEKLCDTLITANCDLVRKCYIIKKICRDWFYYALSLNEKSMQLEHDVMANFIKSTNFIACYNKAENVGNMVIEYIRSLKCKNFSPGCVHFPLERCFYKTLPMFFNEYYEGDYESFPRFWAYFHTFAEEFNFSKLEKFHYLILSLTGEAYEKISRLPFNEDAYEFAIGFLKANAEYEDDEINEISLEVTTVPLFFSSYIFALSNGTVFQYKHDYLRVVKVKLSNPSDPSNIIKVWAVIDPGSTNSMISYAAAYKIKVLDENSDKLLDNVWPRFLIDLGFKDYVKPFVVSAFEIANDKVYMVKSPERFKIKPILKKITIHFLIGIDIFFKILIEKQPRNVESVFDRMDTNIGQAYYAYGRHIRSSY